MKKILLILLGTLIALPALSRDFKYTYEGQTLTYTVMNEEAKTCMTRDGLRDHPGNKVSGVLIIPSIAKDGDDEYSVINIGPYGFYDCSGLTSIEIPNSVIIIRQNAFENCSGLTSIEIPTSVTKIHDGAFEGCSGLTSVTIPSSVTEIGNHAFYGCSGLTSIEVAQENPNYASLDGVLFNKDLSTLIRFPGGRTGEYDIPSSVTEIGSNAFEGCSGLTSIEIPNSVTEIDNRAFEGCSGLTSIEVAQENPNYASLDGVLFNKDLSTLINFPGGRTGEYDIPTSVTEIGIDAFYGCSGLTSIEIPTSVTRIRDGAFEGCSGLTSIEIPNSVTIIPYSAFVGCSGLTSVTIPSSVTEIGYCAFEGCSGLTSIEIPSSVTKIDNLAFYGCSGLTSIEIPNSVTIIPYGAFYGCSGLTSVTIPSSVTEIGSNAFYGCSGLTSVYYLADEPIESLSYQSPFSDSTYENAILYMSEKGIVKGRKIHPWKNFAKIEVYVPTDGIEAIDADIDFNQPCEVYSISGAKVGNTAESLAPGIYIVRQGNAVKKIAVKKIAVK